MFGVVVVRIIWLWLWLRLWPGPWLGLGHIDYVAIVARALHHKGTESGCALCFGLLVLCLAIALSFFSLLFIILGGDHAQWVAMALVSVSVISPLLVEVKERWERGNAASKTGL